MPHAVQPERYGRQWGLFFAATLLVGALAWQAAHIPPHQTAIPPSTGADWFLVLRMPAVTSQYESGIETMRVRYGEWLDALARAGFKPMRLSDVHSRIRSGQGLPEKTVVLVFDPGYRRTYHIVAPILAQHNWPAVWITPEDEMQRGHREYVTYHLARRMTDSGWWDVGFIQKDGRVRLSSNTGSKQYLNEKGQPLWAHQSGGLALNQNSRFNSMNRLNVISDWKGSDLLNRIRVEVPITAPVYLTLGQVQNLKWGITTDADSSEEKHFDLAMPMHRHGLQIAWLGARGHSDMRIEAEADRLVGQMALRLRWDEANQTGVMVVFSNSTVWVKSKADEHTITLRTLTRSGAGPTRPLKTSIELQGQSMVLSIDGRPPVSIDLPPKTPVRPGLVQLYLYDSVKGTGRLDSMKILFTPLSNQ